MNLLTAFHKEFMEQRRSQRLFIAVVVLAVFGLLSPLLAKLTPQIIGMIPGGEQIATIIPTPTVNDAIAQYIKNISQFGVLLTLLFSMGAVAGEKDKGTAAMILSKPMPRGTFLMAKFLAVALTLTIAMAAAALGGYYYTAILFESLPAVGFLAMNGLLLFYMFVYAAVTLFFSTITRTQFIAIGGAAGVLILSGILSSLPTIGKYTPDALIGISAQVALRQPVMNWWPSWISLGLIVAALVCSWLVFRRQEL